ncbi:MAG TPA: hypothetical protein VNO33_19185 [Kofleriaceae bacterium]|nr:hypothetical protein [Kofleriaceae bacterium]
MTEREALQALEDAEVMPVVEGRLLDVKRIWRECLDNDLPVAVAAPPGRT